MGKEDEMNCEKGFTFISECNDLIVITKKYRNGRLDADEISMAGTEEVEYNYDEEDTLIRKNTNIVYGVVDNTGEIIKHQTSFYFDKDLAKGVAKEINKHICQKDKNHKVKEYYLIERTINL